MSRETSIDLEKKVRLYYEDRLGNFVDVGFRLCEGDEEPELRRCLLMRREYDVLVLPYPRYGLRFGDRSIEGFAQGMPCPTILVGPEHKDRLFVNAPARIWVERLGLEDADWEGLPNNAATA
jgi:hypothetical protein